MTSKMKWLSLWLFDNPLLATGPSPSAHPRAGRGNLAQNVPLGVLSGVELLVGMLGEVVRPLLRVDVRRIAVWKTILRKMTPDAVRRAPLFRDLSWRQVRRVMRFGSLEAFEAGQYAARKGEAGTTMYMVISGRLRVFDRAADGRERTLAMVGPGMVSGAVDLVGAGVRMAHVVAELPSEVLALDLQALERIGRRFPFTGAQLFRNVARTLSERLRVTVEALMQIGPPLPSGPPVEATARAIRRQAAVPRCHGIGWGKSRPMTRVGAERKSSPLPAPRGCRGWAQEARRRRCLGHPPWLHGDPPRGRAGQCGRPAPRREADPVLGSARAADFSSPPGRDRGLPHWGHPGR